MKKIEDLLSERLIHTLHLACSFSQHAKKGKIDTVDLVLGMLIQKGSIGKELLNRGGIYFDTVLKEYYETYKDLIGAHNLDQVLKKIDLKNLLKKNMLSASSKDALMKAILKASEYKHRFVGTEHLLFGIIQQKNARFTKYLREKNINILNLKRQLGIVLESSSKFSQLTSIFQQKPLAETSDISDIPFPGMPEPKMQALSHFTVDLTAKSAKSRIDPVIGREKEILRMINILARRTKNNPLLIGPSGVGKTAIVEGLAKKIGEGDVNELLEKKRILALDLTLVISGTIYRGEFEARLKQIIDEASSDPNVILFIDEIHMIIGTGNTQGSMDAANILKPALTKGTLKIIGATTEEEFRKHIEDDNALERRFQPIKILEPSKEDCVKIIAGLKKSYEDFHKIEITKEAVKASVELSDRYLPDRYLPDKAIDLIDEAAAKIKAKSFDSQEQKQAKELSEKLASLEKEKLDAIHKEDFAKGLKIKHEENQVKKSLNFLYEEIGKRKVRPSSKVKEENIAAIIAEMTGIPTEKLLKKDANRLLKLEETLKKKVIGQDDAIETLARFIRRARAGVANPNRPIGSFIFVGSSGVGKTELAKALASEVFGDSRALIRYDMSEFSESFQASKLIGAPPGYVGYKEGDKLTDRIKRQPYSVVLFDEIEKAHPDIFNLLLQILDEGILTDSQGKMINFKNTIIILTSNIGSEFLLAEKQVGFNEKKPGMKNQFEIIRAKILNELKNSFRIEFLNRLDKIVVFRPLSLVDVKKIVDLEMKKLETRLSEKKLEFHLSQGARLYLAKRGYSAEKGVRPLQRVLENLIEDPLAEKILKNEISSGDKVKIVYKKNAIKLIRA